MIEAVQQGLTEGFLLLTFDKAIFRKLSDLRIGLMFFSDRISKLVALKATTEEAATVIGLTGGC